MLSVLLDPECGGTYDGVHTVSRVLSDPELTPMPAQTSVLVFSVMAAFGSQGKLEEADVLYLRAIGIEEKVLAPNISKLATILYNRATGLETQVMHPPFRTRLYQSKITHRTTRDP